MADAPKPDGETRRRIMQSLLKRAPVTAAEIAEEMEMSTAGVRRHLDILYEQDLIEAVHRTVPRGTSRRRGRPARSFRLTPKGRESFGHAYDTLTSLALETLRDVGGEQAVCDLARRRIEEILSEVPHAGSEASVEEIAHALARAFDEHGYAATVTAAGSGVQICQHHCPVSHVAEQFPELCAAEHEAIANRTGLHVQALASIAQGNDVCTTNIPLSTVNTPQERRG
ncbi:helix-turn-helix transcriptional regulator [Corynebacterium atypicum]|nr:metalloregulator ArsR/SmtB family transcription factor [Corynebacterium atypicum]